MSPAASNQALARRWTRRTPSASAGAEAGLQRVPKEPVHPVGVTPTIEGHQQHPVTEHTVEDLTHVVAVEHLVAQRPRQPFEGADAGEHLAFVGGRAHSHSDSRYPATEISRPLIERPSGTYPGARSRRDRPDGPRRASPSVPDTTSSTNVPPTGTPMVASNLPTSAESRARSTIPTSTTAGSILSRLRCSRGHVHPTRSGVGPARHSASTMAPAVEDQGRSVRRIHRRRRPARTGRRSITARPQCTANWVENWSSRSGTPVGRDDQVDVGDRDQCIDQVARQDRCIIMTQVPRSIQATRPFLGRQPGGHVGGLPIASRRRDDSDPHPRGRDRSSTHPRTNQVTSRYAVAPMHRSPTCCPSAFVMVVGT